MSGLLLPALGLITWTMVVWLWMFATRIEAMQRLKINPNVGAQVQTLRERLPPQVRAIGDNYNHLHEQPTLFYALCLVLHVAGVEGPLALGLGWAYVASRVLHSLVQNSFNHVPTRFAVFVFGSLCLMGLMVLGVRAAIG